MNFLKFSKANAKLQRLSLEPAVQEYLRRPIYSIHKGKEHISDYEYRRVYSLDLLSGHTCPFAKECFAYVVEKDGKYSVKDGKHTKYRCYSASQEALYPNLYNLRKYNTDLLKQARTTKRILKLLQESLPDDAGVIRIHSGGDFFSQSYLDAWVELAETRPDVLFYGYTKALPWLLEWEILPENFIFTASRGGKRDDLIDKHKLREALVVFTEEEAWDQGLEIDHDDSHAAKPGKSFALLVHGIQPKGSEAGRAVHKLNGRGSYGR